MTTPTTPEPTLKARLARIAPFFRDGKRGLLLAFIGAVIGAATEPAIPALMQPLLDTGFQRGALPLWAIPLAIIGLFALRGFAGFIAQYGLSWAANRGMLNLRRAMFARLLDAQPSLFGQHTASSLVNTVTFEVQNGANQLVYSFQTLVRDSLTLLALLGYLLWINWQLTLFVLVLLPAVALVMRVLSKRLHRLTVQSQKATDELAYVVEENVLAWRIVRLHGAQAMQAQRFGAVSDMLRRLTMKSTVAAATMTPLTQMLAACALSAVIVAALWQSGQGGAGGAGGAGGISGVVSGVVSGSASSGTSVGGFVAFVIAMLQLVAPIKHLSEVAGPITRGLAALDRGVAMVDTVPAEVGGGYGGSGVEPAAEGAAPKVQGKVELRHVSLRYGSSDTAALDDVSLLLQPGETVALVGPSGAGKSTLVNLLPRFIEPTAGTLLLDDRPLADWDVHALRRQFALVSQDVVLFNDTVAANVALGDLNNIDSSVPADAAKVEQALRDANLWEFVCTLPQGMHSRIGHNGGQLSGGQRQRLAIARAIYKDATVLILDEATSALDSESERLVQDALQRLMRGRTSLVIAHRLSTIERADRIVALEAGRVVEQGTHAELLAHDGLYARLYLMQFRT